MEFASSRARKGVLTGAIAFSLAMGSGYVVQTVLAPAKPGSELIPAMPVTPEAVRIPIVLRTPPRPNLPDRFG